MDIRFAEDVGSFAKFLIDMGLDHIELRAGYLNVREDGPTPETLRDIARTHDLTYSIHAPHIDVAPGNINDHLRSAVVDATTELLDFAAAIDAVGVVVHGGSVRTRYPERVHAYVRERSIETIRACAHHAAEVGVPLCLENQRTRTQKRRFTATPERLGSFLEAVDVGPEALRITLDVGHAKASEIEYDRFVDRFADRIHLVHLHDNDGTTDSHEPLPSFRAVGEAIGAPYNILEMKTLADIERCVRAASQ